MNNHRVRFANGTEKQLLALTLELKGKNLRGLG